MASKGNSRGPKLPPNARRPRRNNDAIRREIDILKEEHFPGEETDRNITDGDLTPERELVMRQILRGGAQTGHSEPAYAN